MKTIQPFLLLLTAIVGLASSGCTNAQYGSQPGYSDPNYGNQSYPNQGYGNQPYANQQPYSNQPGYGQPGYDNPDFYSSLSPYGQWVQTPECGTVWIPQVAPGFQPYATNGHWVVTEYGNTWVSDYAWGWAPFHYGRWYYDNYRGWAWVPGTDWGPAWVSWRSGGGYYGWAPLGPGMNVGVNVNINIAPNFWTFVPQIYITSPQIYSYYVPRPRVINIYQNTTYINNIYRSNNRAYYYGPPRNEIENVTRRSVPVYRIERQDRPGRYDIQNGAVRIYQPDIARNSRGSYTPSGNGNGRSGNNSGGYSQPNQREYTPNTGGRDGVYSTPFDNRPPASRGRSYDPAPTPSTPNRSYDDNRSRGGYSSQQPPSPVATPAPTTPDRSYDDSRSRGGYSPRQPVDMAPPASSRGSFDPGQSRGSYTPPAQPTPERPTFDRGERPQSGSFEQRGGGFQQPRGQEQPQQGRGSYQPQPVPQQAAPRTEPGARQEAAPAGGGQPNNGRGSRGPR